MPKEYKLYKGLQKPLVFRGFKGRYIYWGIGIIVFSFLFAGIIGSIFNMIVGIIGMVIIFIGGLYWVIQKQKNGLHDKDKTNNVIVIMPNNLKSLKHVKNEKANNI